MLRRLFTILVLIAVVGWLILSYLPAGTVTLPQLSFSAPWTAPGFFVLALSILAVFAGIQIWLVWATVRLFREPAGSLTAEAVHTLGLRQGREVFWTALPLAATLGFGLALLTAR
jgi:hypothetical protein